MRTLLLFLFLVHAVQATIIIPDRLGPYERIYVGVSNGIPDSSAMTIFQTVAAGASLATVQGHINNCPSNQVVKLSAGAYTFGGSLFFDGHRGVVLKGAGIGLTTVTFTSSDDGCFMVRTPGSDAAFNVDANLSGNTAKNGTALTLASVPSWVTAGGLIGIDEMDEPSFVDHTIQQTGQNYRSFLGNGNRNFGEVNRVLSKTSTTIILERPLLYSYKTTQTAQIYQPGYDPSTDLPICRVGIEDMKVVGNASFGSGHRMVYFNMADSCWVKNVNFDPCVDSGIFWYFGYRCEIRGCTFQNFTQSGAGQGYGIAPYYNVTGLLVEDNIVSGAHAAFPMSSSSGNVYAYNVELPGAALSGQVVSISTHQCHSAFNLFEGNWCVDKALFDCTHGSGSHNTVFRNTIIATNSTGGNSDSTSCVSIEYFNRYCNVVGNILGQDGQQTKYLSYNGSPSEGAGGSILVMGGEVNINDDYNPSDDFSFTSGMFVLVHGNWDTVQDQQTWEPSIVDHLLVGSYIYGSKPSFFGFLAWPPFTPTGVSTASITNIPAGYRWINGTNPAISISLTNLLRDLRVRGVRLGP